MIKALPHHKYIQYQRDVFTKLDFDFKAKKKLLDVGCGDFKDAKVFINEFNLDYYGIDIYIPKKIKEVKNIKFKKASIYKIPYKNNSFDYVFIHDVLHHIDEENQDYQSHIKGLKELKRVCKKGGYIICVEANRYNPLFYPHMVKMCGHNHFRQRYFKNLIVESFPDAKEIIYKFFEAHVYPKRLMYLFKIYDYIMDRFIPEAYRAYNVAIIRKK